MTTARNSAPRRERLRVRLTAEEATYIEELAAARGLTVSDLVRSVLFRGRGPGIRVGRRSMVAESAGIIRELNAIGMDLRRLVASAQANGTITDLELGACLARVQAAIAGFGP